MKLGDLIASNPQLKEAIAKATKPDTRAHVADKMATDTKREKAMYYESNRERSTLEKTWTEGVEKEAKDLAREDLIEAFILDSH